MFTSSQSGSFSPPAQEKDLEKRPHSGGPHTVGRKDLRIDGIRLVSLWGSRKSALWRGGVPGGLLPPSHPPAQTPCSGHLTGGLGSPRGVSHSGSSPAQQRQPFANPPVGPGQGRLLSPLLRSPGMPSISVSGIPGGEARGSAAEPCWPPTSLSAYGGSGACVLPYVALSCSRCGGSAHLGPRLTYPEPCPPLSLLQAPPATTTRARSLKATSRSCLQPPVPRLRKPSS